MLVAAHGIYAFALVVAVSLILESVARHPDSLRRARRRAVVRLHRIANPDNRRASV